MSYNSTLGRFAGDLLSTVAGKVLAFAVALALLVLAARLSDLKYKEWEADFGHSSSSPASSPVDARQALPEGVSRH